MNSKEDLVNALTQMMICSIEFEEKIAGEENYHVKLISQIVESL